MNKPNKYKFIPKWYQETLCVEKEKVVKEEINYHSHQKEQFFNRFAL